MARHEAYIAKNWQDHGMPQVVVARSNGDGSVDFGVFLVDVWCLGVKDAFGESDVVESSFREFVEERLPEDLRESIHPSCAKKLIEGALAYAERLGFAPHRDYRKARRVLSGIDAGLCPVEYSFGREGRPCFVRGPDDSDERVDRVLAILQARVGPEGYDYEDPELEEDDDAREALLEWLEGEAEEVPRFYRVSGMVAALRLSPQPAVPADVHELIWPEGREWEDEDARAYFDELLEGYWSYVGDLLEAAAAPHAPESAQAIDIWMDDLPEEQLALATAAAMVEWATGFMEVVEHSPEAWDEALHRADLAGHWEMIRWWAEFVGTDNKNLIADAAEGTPPRNIGLSARALARALLPAGPSKG